MKPFSPRPYQNLILSHEIDIKRSNVWAGMVTILHVAFCVSR